MRCPPPTHAAAVPPLGRAGPARGGTALLRLLGLLALAAPAAAGAQGHQHPVAPSAADPLLTVILEGPHLALAHDGFIVLAREQVRALREARAALCEGEVQVEEERARTRAELARVLAEGAGEAGLRPPLERLAAAETAWTLALFRARAATRALLRPEQREQLEGLAAHWAREANAMIEAATEPGHRGHPGRQLPIRVPGMVVAATTLAPFCEQLHGPGSHLSIPPPPP